MSRFIGNVSAYAYAVSQGYTGTEEEYAELMASYATVAEQAEESAESASQSATQAGASAQTATTKASEASQSATQAGASATSASQSATTATTKASEASQSAQTATTKASEASASASTAGTKASEASTSATTASSKASEASQSATAASASEANASASATAAAQSASDAADSASDAQTAAANAHIEKAFPTDTASGSVVSFADGADDIPMKSVKVAIEPVQDLHGYDNPWPAGGGKNILPYASKDTDSKNGVTWTKNSDGSITFSGTCSDSAAMTFVEFKLPAGDYLFSNVGSTFAYTGGSRPNVYVRDLDNALTLGTFEFGQFADRVPFSLSAETNIRFYTVFQTDNVVSGVLYPMIRLASVTDATYAPYSNICPISGWTGAQVSHSGADTSNPTTYSITFPTEAGTVYGGELDVTNGTLTVDRAFIASYNGETLPSEWISDRDKYVAGTTPTTGAQVVYKLATPITYTLTPTEIKSLLGDNNIWADAGGIALTYRADPNLYIDKRIGTEAPMVATDNIVSGSYFMVGSDLYKATANIASGAEVVVGTNATAKTMAEALNEINA